MFKVSLLPSNSNITNSVNTEAFKAKDLNFSRNKHQSIEFIPHFVSGVLLLDRDNLI